MCGTGRTRDGHSVRTYSVEPVFGHFFVVFKLLRVSKALESKALMRCGHRWLGGDMLCCGVTWCAEIVC